MQILFSLLKLSTDFRVKGGGVGDAIAARINRAFIQRFRKAFQIYNPNNVEEK